MRTEYSTNPFFFSEGWEQLGLYDYYKEKSQSVKRKETEINDGVRERSRSPSPVIIEPPPEEDEKPSDQPVRRYRWSSCSFHCQFVYVCAVVVCFVCNVKWLQMMLELYIKYLQNCYVGPVSGLQIWQ